MSFDSVILDKAEPMKRITRGHRLTPEEAAKYKAVREQVTEELPDLIARHHERMAALDPLRNSVDSMELRSTARKIGQGEIRKS